MATRRPEGEDAGLNRVMVSQITKLKLTQFYGWAKQHHSRSPSGGCEHMRHIKTMLRWAEEYDVCTNPIERFPSVSRHPAETRRPSEGDLKKLLATVSGDTKDIVLFGLLTGLRPFEICALRTDQVCRDTSSRWYVLIEQHKTSRSSRTPMPRSVPLSKEASVIVHRQMANHPKSGFVFLNSDGVPFSSQGLRQRLQRWCERAGIRRYPTYSLRHAFASMQSDRGVNQISLATLMGHTSVRTTARYVTNSSDFHKHAVDDLAQQVEGLLGKNGASEVATQWPPTGGSEAGPEEAKDVNAVRRTA